MKTEKLTQLLSTIKKPANDVQQPSQAAKEPQQAETADAVSVSISNQAANLQFNDSAQAEKVARIKEQVQNGKYDVDSKRVAAAFVTELGLI